MVRTLTGMIAQTYKAAKFKELLLSFFSLRLNACFQIIKGSELTNPIFQKASQRFRGVYVEEGELPPNHKIRQAIQLLLGKDSFKMR